MRLSFLAALILFLTIGCTQRAEELLPIPPSLKGASRVTEVEVTIARHAKIAVNKLDESLGRGAEPFAQLLERSMREAAQEAGLTSGRALKLTLEVDALQVADSGSALLGRNDRLRGSAYVRDASTGEDLGHIYVDIDRNNGGFLNALSRIGNVRESLAGQFGAQVAAALGGKRR